MHKAYSNSAIAEVSFTVCSSGGHQQSRTILVVVCPHAKIALMPMKERKEEEEEEEEEEKEEESFLFYQQVTLSVLTSSCRHRHHSHVSCRPAMLHSRLSSSLKLRQYDQTHFSYSQPTSRQRHHHWST